MQPLTVYKASAGSGKTFTLAVEYVKLLVLYAGEKEFTHILAVTFTNKATTEMKDRIIAHLYGVGGTDHVLPSSRSFFSKLRQELGREPGFSASDEEIRRRCRLALHQILHDYSHFRVQTIDAFFQTILRGLAQELGLTANLQVEISDTEVLSEAVDRIIDRLQDEPEVQSWLFSLVQEQIENNQRWDVTREVKDFGRAIFNETYLRQGDQLRQVLADPQRLSRFMQELTAQRDQAVACCRAGGNQLAAAVRDGGVQYADFSNGKNLATFVEKLQRGELDVKVGARIEGWAADPLGLVKKADRSARPELLDVADAVSTLLADTLQQLPQWLRTYNSARLALRHIKPLRLLDFIDREVTAINAETSRFNLAKTPIFLNRMVGRDDAPFIFEKMGAMLHHIMIDEFQDTSRLQWENFCVLLLDTYARGGRNLLVGDVKQSIYRWRGGDWRMLGYIDREVSPAPLVERLGVNYRSATQVVQFNNQFFREAADLLDVESEPSQQLLGIEKRHIHDDAQGPARGLYGQAYGDVHQDSPEGKPASGYVQLTLLDTTQEPFGQSDEWQAWVLQDMCRQVKQLLAAGVPENKITILVRYNREIQPIIQAFASTPGMPKIVSDEAFLLSASPAVELLVAALRLMDDPEEPVARELLREWGFDQLPAEANAALPLADLLEWLYTALHLADIPGQDAFLFGFFDAVADYLRDGQADIHSFLSHWDETLSRKSIPAGRADGIRILSIHKSKGLEFHTVLMPFCAWEFERDRWDSLLWCQPSEMPYAELGLLPISPSARTAENSVFQRDYVEEHVQSRLDELNALYVGFTRAESNLIAWAPFGNREHGLHTVGDLIAALAMPHAAENVGASDAETGVTICTWGTCAIPNSEAKPVAETAADDSERDLNRMEPQRTQLPVQMVSRMGTHQFRQSNRSQQFVRQVQAEAQFDAAGDTAVGTPAAVDPAVGISAEEEALLLEQSRQQEYIDTGLLLHSLFQRIGTAADIPQALAAFETEGLLTPTSVSRKRLQEMIERAMRNKQVASWFDGSWQLYRECGIAAIDPHSHQPVTLRPDRVMRSADGRQVVVVDFKFGRPHEGYDEQVQRYMQLVAQIYPDATVTGYLWFVLRGKVEEIKVKR